MEIATKCPICESTNINFLGIGTESVEEELYKALPGIKILRMDQDTTRTKNAHKNILRAFENKEADVLLGTQMIAKGLDFGNVTLVGVISCEQMLNLPESMRIVMLESMLKELLAPRIQPALDEINANGSYAILKVAE